MKNRMRKMFCGCVLGFFLVGCLGATLQAAPMFGETMEFRQPDGTEVPVVLFGDEFYMRGETPDGYTVLRDPDTGWICYAELSSEGSELVPTQERYLNAMTTEGMAPGGDGPIRVVRRLEVPTVDWYLFRDGINHNTINRSEQDFFYA